MNNLNAIIMLKIFAKNSQESVMSCTKYDNKKVLMMLYYSLVYSALQYGILPWGSASNTVLKPLNIIHNKIARLITKVTNIPN